MKRGILLLLFCFAVFGILLNYAHFVVADEGNNNHTAEQTSVNEEHNNSTAGHMSVNESNNSNEEFNVTGENGNETQIEVHHQIEQQGNVTIEENNFTDENLNNITIINKNEINENNSNGEFEVNGVKADSEVKLETSFENNKTEIKAEVGNRNETIMVMPDNASQIAFKALSDKGFTLKLIVVGQGNETRVVYSADLNQTGNLLGLIPVNLSSNALISSQNGDVVSVNRPWWIFLVVFPKTS